MHSKVSFLKNPYTVKCIGTITINLTHTGIYDENFSSREGGIAPDKYLQSKYFIYWNISVNTFGTGCRMAPDFHSQDLCLVPWSWLFRHFEVSSGVVEDAIQKFWCQFFVISGNSQQLEKYLTTEIWRYKLLGQDIFLRSLFSQEMVKIVTPYFTRYSFLVDS